MAEKNEKVKHENIYAALAAFQGENPEIKKTKKVDFPTDKGRVSYMYAPLDEFVAVVRPLLAKHGLSFVHQEAGEGKIQCVLFHETSVGKLRSFTNTNNIVVDQETSEVNIIRSMPITVRRSGDMKNIGADATYARRYTLAEVTGVASDEDNDAPISEESAKNAVKTVFTSFKEKMKDGDKDYVTKTAALIEKELDRIAKNKAPQLGLTKSQYEELWGMADERIAELNDTQETAEDKSVNVE